MAFSALFLRFQAVSSGIPNSAATSASFLPNIRVSMTNLKSGLLTIFASTNSWNFSTTSLVIAAVSGCSIKGKRERRVAEQVENFFYQECFWGRFTREVVLPSEVDKNKAEASMKNGVLTIKIPKIHVTKSKKLDINIE